MKRSISKYQPLVWIGVFALMFTACGDEPKPIQGNGTLSPPPAPVKKAPQFSADSAYAFIEAQLAFGPRVPNSKGHQKAGDYLVERLSSWADTVLVQEANVVAYTGEGLKIRNIMARFDPEKSDRIMLFAHWDTRHISDKDATLGHLPVPGADDGGSGVGVLMEIARLLAADSSGGPSPGIDIVLFDGEDFGDAGGAPETFCLGSQYFAKNPMVPGYRARYGILLDLVGAKGAVFYQEGWSLEYAPHITQKVWETAHQVGYASYFRMAALPGPITDDHYFINKLMRIPSIDIINYDPSRPSGFPAHWHTQKDNIDIISKETLGAVGTTVLEVLYREPEIN